MSAQLTNNLFDLDHVYQESRPHFPLKKKKKKADHIKKNGEVISNICYFSPRELSGSLFTVISLRLYGCDLAILFGVLSVR